MRDIDRNITWKVDQINAAQDEQARKVLNELGLKDGQVITEEELFIVLKAICADEDETCDKMSLLVNSPFLRAKYTVDFSAEREKLFEQ